MSIPGRASIGARMLAIGVCGIALLIATPSVVQAVPIEINFSVGGETTTTTGTGTAVVDSSRLEANLVTDDLAALQDFTLSLTGIPASPSSTTFTKADLTFWFLQTDSAANIVDLNFFMSSFSANTDGYSIEGVFEFHFILCDGATVGGFCVSGDPIDTLTVSVTSVEPVDGTVPEPTTLSLLGLGLAGIGARRWRQRKT